MLYPSYQFLLIAIGGRNDNSATRLNHSSKFLINEVWLQKMLVNINGDNHIEGVICKRQGWIVLIHLSDIIVDDTVKEYYAKAGLLCEIDADGTVGEVYEKVKSVIRRLA